MAGRSAAGGAPMALSFRLGPIPVHVHVWFLTICLVPGLGAHRGALGVALWTAGFLVTALAHELGHALALHRFGARAEVNLSFVWPGAARATQLTADQRAIVALAGPAVSLALGATALAVFRKWPPPGPVTAAGLQYLASINLGWGLINLLPVFPLDGGHVVACAIERSAKRRRMDGQQVVHVVSVGFGIVGALLALGAKMPLLAFLCGMVALQNARFVRSPDQGNREAALRAHVQAAFDALERGDAIVAIRHCRIVLGTSCDPATRRDAVRLLAYAFATGNDWCSLVDLLEAGGVRALDASDLERYQIAALELGRPQEAERIALLR
ncbi:MAG: site-2 protease family protein [Polyangiaceae bacterium]|nr:site-2 protease family protein [Polyangiaceae bacterium]